jgi:hypothetical protein
VLNLPFIAGSSERGAIHQLLEMSCWNGGMGAGIVRHVVLLAMALALGIALGAVTKFGLGRNLAVALETNATSVMATR